METEDPAVRDFMRAGAALLEAAVSAVKAEDPSALDGLAAYLRDGGTMTAALRLAPAIGVGEIQVGVLGADGQVRVLRTANIRRQAHS